ncbi:MAG: peptidylprolyl isomerase [Pararhodobacter sp.]
MLNSVPGILSTLRGFAFRGLATARRTAGALGAAGALGLAALAFGAAAPAVSHAQSPFSAALYVNDSPITNYEITQRMRFMEFIGAASGGDRRAAAVERLIEDRLQRQESRRVGLRASSEDIRNGMAEFAARAELSTEEMIAQLGQAGVDADTFRDFVHAGILWRDLVNARFGPEIRITDAQVERALSLAAVRPMTEILISEIFLPSDPQFADVVNQLIPQLQELRTIEAFADAARQVSAAPSNQQGGRVDRWIPMNELPDEIGSAFDSASIGTVIGPLEFPGAFAFFQLRARRDTRDVPAGQIEYEYRRASLPGGQSETNRARAARIRASVDSCADLGAVVGQVVPELPEGAVSTITRPRPEIDAATAAELGRLNPGGISTNLTQSGEMVLLMLCNRRVISDPRPTQSQVRNALFNQALEGRAEIYLQQLRAEAEIRRP